jgi:hypothetical protein
MLWDPEKSGAGGVGGAMQRPFNDARICPTYPTPMRGGGAQKSQETLGVAPRGPRAPARARESENITNRGVMQ